MANKVIKNLDELDEAYEGSVPLDAVLTFTQLIGRDVEPASALMQTVLAHPPHKSLLGRMVELQREALAPVVADAYKLRTDMVQILGELINICTAEPEMLVADTRAGLIASHSREQLLSAWSDENAISGNDIKAYILRDRFIA